MAPEPLYVEFQPDDRGEVLTRMEELAAADDGWLNLQPAVDSSLEPEAYRSGLFGFLSASGPPVPVCTWAPRDRGRDHSAPVSIGVQHGSGPKAARRLEEQGLVLGTGWVVLQDHPRRGLVVSVPREEDDDRVLRWLLDAGRLLSSVPLAGTWRAAFYFKR